MATWEVFAFTPKILVQLDTLCSFLFFFPSTARLLKFTWCLPIATSYYGYIFFQFPVQWLVARLVAQKDKCRSINYKPVIQYTHHNCNLKSVYSVLYLCTKAAAVQIFSGTCFFSAMTFFNQSDRWPPKSRRQLLAFLEAVWQTHHCENSKEKVCTILKEKFKGW